MYLIFLYSFGRIKIISKCVYTKRVKYITMFISFSFNNGGKTMILHFNKNILIFVLKTTILDGRTGKPLLPKAIKMVVGTQTSPLVISVKGKGNDIFLYWVSDCHGAQNKSELEFDFLKGIFCVYF